MPLLKPACKRFVPGLLVLPLFFLLTGFKLEKDMVEMTKTESKKAPEPGEEKKVKEVPASPKFKMDSFDNFMTEGPIQRSTPEPKKVKRKTKSKTSE